VQPDTVVHWYRKGFRLYWRSILKPGPGRPHIPGEVQALIRRFATENGWRARKIQAELEKLGVRIGSPPSLDIDRSEIPITINASTGRRSFAITDTASLRWISSLLRLRSSTISGTDG
jgi:hypothetical protein